jgi:predicted DNA-binding transcriptional regulator YafY
VGSQEKVTGKFALLKNSRLTLQNLGETRGIMTMGVIEELPDGSLILCLRARGLDEVKRWVMGYGSHAEVRAPPTLRAAVTQEVGRLAEIYLE